MRLKSVMRAAVKGMVLRKKDLSSSRIDLSTGGRKSEGTCAELKLIFLDSVERDMNGWLQHPFHHSLTTPSSQCDREQVEKGPENTKIIKAARLPLSD